ncbi:PACE efflux transporter [Paragemmobacter straminiformis]|uniref:PACE efflux transporter n=1 Tax=Paragemmobacter straminiformis TaxID=2045119 RepID=A0A842I8A6_9RHOB|nr:PACE efflux transporter [Gemmobacter straminiformis]MBC2835865.1 PACE efflux transporter [Gemmobacter straminiformis]
MALHDRPTLRRLIYAAAFEGGGILMSTALLLLMADTGAGSSFVFSALCSTIAMLWNLAFNALFEAWEARQTIRGRGLARRTAHALLFEAGLLLVLLPLTAWWFAVPVLTALAYESVLILAFLAYTWAFTWAFDRLFGLPASAR